MNTFAGTTSVGTITDADLKTLAVYAENPQWPFKAFAKHAVASSLRSISTISFARTWRITSTFEPTAGGEGCVTLHCGQPLRNPAALLVFAMPLRRQGKNSPDEQLEKAIMLQPMAKGASKALRYGPVCRSGAHIVCVSLNGAHVVGSPMHVTVAPGAPEPTRCELVPSPSTTYGTAGAARGEATREIVVWLQLRDRYGNRCTREAAIEVVEHGDLAVSVTRITNVDGTHPEQQLGYPSALSPAAGSDAAKGLVTWTVRVVEESDGCAPGSSSRSEGSEKVPRGFREGSEKRWFRVGRRRRLDAWSRVPRLERGARRRAQRQRAPRGAAARKCVAAHGAAWARQGHCLDRARRRRGRDHELLAMHRRGVTPAASRRTRRARERSSDSRARQVGGLHALERR